MLARVRESPGESLRTMVMIDTSTATDFDTGLKLRLFYGNSARAESRYYIEQAVGHCRHREPLGKQRSSIGPHGIPLGRSQRNVIPQQPGGSLKRIRSDQTRSMRHDLAPDVYLVGNQHRQSAAQSLSH